MATPLANSTMINDKTLGIEDDSNNLSFNNFNGYIKYVHGKLRLSKSPETDSVNTIQTSLNVNTSIDVENRDINTSENLEKTKCINLGNVSKDVHSTVVEEESINTNSTSLQMNTSLDISNQLQRRNNSKNSDLLRNKKGASNSYENFNEPNCKLQNQNQTLPHENHSNVASNIILNNSSSGISYTENTCVNINASAEKNELNDQNMKYFRLYPIKGKSKRKLLPIRECSQLASFSPVQKESSPLQNVISKKKKKKKRDICNKKTNITNSEYKKTAENEDSNKKKSKKPRKILSKKIVIKKIVDEDILKILEKKHGNINETEADICTLQRGSTSEFQPLKRLSQKHVQRINIVATGLSNEDKCMVKSIIKSLGSAKFELNVTKHTTHVVSTGVRTIKLLHGIIRGCWLVNLEWVLRSFENGSWLNPEDYEMAHFSKTVRENRKDKQLFGKYYTPELFIACGYIYVQQKTTPPCDVLKGLIKAAGGRITENSQTAQILIGEGGLKESWVLDCITSGELQPYDQYQRS